MTGNNATCFFGASGRLRLSKGLMVFAVLAAFTALFPEPAHAQATVRLKGPGLNVGPIQPDPDGRFAFRDVPLQRNSVNTLTVTASDAAGATQSRDVTVTQISLESVVVSRISTRPLPPEEVIQLVEDGVIDLKDPQNFNVSKFEIVLTIGNRPVPISVPVAVPIAMEPTGYETYQVPNDPGSGGSNPPNTEVVVFETFPPSIPGEPPPPPIPGVIIIEGKIKTLKEFFGVRLLLLNTSGIFTLSDVKAEISFPDGGLSPTLPVDGIAAFGDILPGILDEPGQKEREFIIRGDEIGRRKINVAFGGRLTGPGIPDDLLLPFSGSARAEVEVKGPPSFRVLVKHPSSVIEDVPYDLGIDITNTGDTPALYASLELDVGADAKLLDCKLNPTTQAVDCEEAEGSLEQAFGHILPGQKVSATFRVKPLRTGPITSCMAIADQNIELQVRVGSIGCLVGSRPPETADPDGLPTASVLPYAGAFGVSTESPVVAFFSKKMNLSTITQGKTGSFRVLDDRGEAPPGRLRLEEIGDRTVAIWQLEDGITNRLTGNSTYTVQLTTGIADLAGNPLAAAWTSSFSTTSAVDDRNAPTLTLGIEPPTDPGRVIPGERVRVNAYASDQGTGVSRIEIRLRDQDVPDSELELIDQKAIFEGTEPPCIFELDSSRLVPGHIYQVVGSAYDNAGNVQDATVALVLATSAAGPVIRLPADPAAPVLHGISINVTPLQVTESARRVAYFLDGAQVPRQTSTVAPYTAWFSTLGLSAGAHTVRAVAEDGLGQTGQDTLQFLVVENRNEPFVSFGELVDGLVHLKGTAFRVMGTAEDPTGIAQMNFYLDTPAGQPISTGPGTFDVDTSQLSPGAHSIILVATNQVGVSSSATRPEAVLEFTVAAQSQGAPPPAPIVTRVAVNADGDTTVEGTTRSGARVSATNLATGVSAAISAALDGTFRVVIPALAGQTIELSALDPGSSPDAGPTATVTVPSPATLVALEVTPGSLRFVRAGELSDLQVTGRFSDGTSLDVTPAAQYRTDRPAVAAAAATGRIAAIGPGTATVTVSYLGVEQAITVTCDIVTLTGLEVTPSPITLDAIGARVTVLVRGLLSNGTQQATVNGVTFATGDPSIATVTASGQVTAVRGGTTQLTVSAAGVPPAVVGVTVSTAQDPIPTISILEPPSGTEIERGQLVTAVARVRDVGGGAQSVTLELSGAIVLNETRQISPASLDATVSFTFVVPASAPLGEVALLSVQARDTSGGVSTRATATLTIADRTAPGVIITAPAAGTLYNFGDTITLEVRATDAVGVSRVRYVASGGISLNGFRDISGSPAATSETFELRVPFGGTEPEVALRAFARDAAGNEAGSSTVLVRVTSADITPPATQITAVSSPGSAATATITYAVTEGLSDLDHVEIYFRRNGIGTFARFTDALRGNPTGRFTPQAGATGTSLFDSTRMGGDGTYEFYSVGVDRAGNRERAPEAAGVVVSDAGATRAFATGQAVTTITTATEIADGSLDNRNLRIVGATVTLVGARSFRNVELLNGAVLTHRPATATSVQKLELAVDTLTIDGTSRVDLAGRGYLGGTSATGEVGRTVGNAPGSTSGNGGSHGGLGGHYSGAAGLAAPIYDDLVEPVEPGSGGGGWAGQAGGAGGGVLVLRAVNLVVDGAVRANGGESQGSAAGDGAGGSVQLLLSTVSGKGTISADGGGAGSGTGGGGGRVSISYVDVSTANKDGITALGGVGSFGTGTIGTVFLRESTTQGGELVIDGFGPSSPFSDLVLPAGFVFDSLTIRRGARSVVSGPIAVRGRLLVTGNSVLTHASGSEGGLSITADSVQVDAGSAIDASGRGYAAASASSPGKTLGGADGASSGVAGSHGGFGGGYQGTPPAPAYGDWRFPRNLGSSGSGWAGQVPGSGGGRVEIHATSAVKIDGALRADGARSSGSASGNGSGGSILLFAPRLGGQGAITANGGGDGTGVGGGGGRVALHVGFIEAGADFSGLRSIAAHAGRGSFDTRPASSGTVLVKRDEQEIGTLYLDAGLTTDTAPGETPLTLLPFGVAAGVSAGGLTTDGLTPVLPGGLVGLRLNPDVLQNETFRILENDATTVTVATPNENGTSFASVAGVGKVYSVHLTVDELIVRGGAAVAAGGRVEVLGACEITERSLLTHVPTTLTKICWLELDAGELFVASDSRIDVSGRGYLGATAGGGPGRTTGNAPGSGDGSGGSHAGSGSRYPPSSGFPGPTYGSFAEPSDLGSGGGSWSGQSGGSGGGLMTIRAGSITVDGSLLALGGESGGSAAGDGSGGSIRIFSGTLAGSGVILADGGGRSNGVGGGGGRIAIKVTTALSVPEANFHALGGTGAFGPKAGDGTVYLERPGQTGGELVIDAGGAAGADGAFVLPGGAQFASLTLRNRAFVTSDSLLRVTGTLRLQSGAVLTHTAGNEAGLRIEARRVEVDATSAIDVSGRGYAGGVPGNDQGRTLGGAPGAGAGTGGSHAGIAGSFAGNLSNPIHGSVRLPRNLGSGGGTWGGQPGGRGGGAIEINADALVLEGALRADGGESGGSAAGDGSGGSVLVRVASLSGAGEVSADGGGGNGGTAGGGGRVAVHYRTALGLPESKIHAFGGSAPFGGPAGDGTVYYLRPGQAQGELVLAGEAPQGLTDRTPFEGGSRYDHLTLRGQANVTALGPLLVTGNLTITGGSILSHPSGDEAGLDIDAARIEIEVGSSIDVRGRGYAGGVSGAPEGQTLGGIAGSSQGAGGSHGGEGGGYQNAAAGLPHGNPKLPENLGSGGGFWSGNAGGSGGGRVTIRAGEGLVVNGAIRADGGESQGSAAGDGSGGSILIDAALLSGSGAISAGAPQTGSGVAGGGGRVALYLGALDQENNLDGLRSVTAVQGLGTFDTRGASAGTVYVKLDGQIDGDLIIDAASPSTSRAATPLTLLPFGRTASVSTNRLGTDALTQLLPGGLRGLRINPDVLQGETFEILENTTSEIVVETPNEHGVAFTSVAAPGKEYAGAQLFDNITLRRGGALALGDQVKVAGTFEVGEACLLLHMPSTDVFVSRLELDVGTFVVFPTGLVDVTGLGYVGANGSTRLAGRTLGNLPGSAEGTGGSHGGLGARYSGASGAPNPVYGIAANPGELGSGGGAWGGQPGGNGGGRISILAREAMVDGVLRASGGRSGGSAAGCGSGGSIRLEARIITGTGSLVARGGEGVGVGGGGGRVLVRYRVQNDLPPGNLDVTGGAGPFAPRAGDGSVLVAQGATFGGNQPGGGGGALAPGWRELLEENSTPDGAILFRRGDSNADGNINLSDSVYTLRYLFLGGAAPACEKASDADDSGRVDLTDAVYALRALFLGAVAIPAPFPGCGLDPTPDTLGCPSGGSCLAVR